MAQFRYYESIFQVIIYIEAGSKRIQFRLRDDAQNSGYSAAQANLPISEFRWYHVTCTFDAAAKVMKLYLNGQLSQTVTYTYTGTFSFDKLLIGNNYYPNANPTSPPCQ